MPAACRVCGQPEDLSEPFIDGACGDCLRKASGVEPPKKKKAQLPRAPAFLKGDPLSDSVMEALGIDDSPRQVMAEQPPVRATVSPFRPRDYPALRTISRIYRVAAVLVGALFCIAELILIVGFMSQLSSALDIEPLVRSFVISQLIFISSCGSLILTFVAIAEAIRVGLDIQNNTHAAAHFSEQTANLSRAT
jgi:hypothetical protein